MRHLVIGQRQKAPNFSAFHWSPHGCLITIGQHFVTTRVVHLPKRTETSLITESDQSRPNHQLLQLCTARTAWSDSDQAVGAVHSCKSWFKCWYQPFKFTYIIYKMGMNPNGTPYWCYDAVQSGNAKWQASHVVAKKSSRVALTRVVVSTRRAL